MLTGHSLGGAVAQLAALRLLKRGGGGGGQQRAADPPSPTCIAFAAPALGNAALASDVAARGWGTNFYNLTFADDAVPRVLADVDAGSGEAGDGGGGGEAGRRGRWWCCRGHRRAAAHHHLHPRRLARPFCAALRWRCHRGCR